MSINSEVDAVEEMKSHENEEDAEDDIGDFIVHGEAAEEIRPKINVDDVLRELVERKSKMQSYSQFNLDAAVAVSTVPLPFIFGLWLVDSIIMMFSNRI